MAKIIPTLNSTRKEKITYAAAALFRQNGYRATSMREIAEALGVEAPSLYNHISSKQEMLEAICFRVGDSFLSNFDRIEKDGSSFIKKVETIIRFHIRIMIEDYDMMYVAEHDWRYLPEPHHEEFGRMRKRYRAKFSGLLAEGMKGKKIIPLDPNVAVLTVLSAVNGVDSWHRSGKKIDAASLEENIVALLLRGLAS